MTRRPPALAFAAPALAVAALAACATTPQRPAAPQLLLETLKTITQTLSSDEYEGRAPTTPGEEKTVALLAGAFA